MERVVDAIIVGIGEEPVFRGAGRIDEPEMPMLDLDNPIA